MSRAVRIQTAWIALLLLLAAFPVQAEESASVEVRLNLDAAQEIVNAGEYGWDLNRILRDAMSGEFELDADGITRFIRDELSELFSRILPDFAAALVPVLLFSLLTQLLPEKASGGAKMARFACAAASALTLTRRFHSEAELAKASIRQISSLTDALTPALTVMLTVTGGTRSASLITPAGALASRLMALAEEKGALALCAAGACVAVADGAGGLALRRLGAFLRSCAKKLLLVTTSCFFALVSTGGLLNGVYDGAALKGAKLAAGTFIPIIGGEIADTMESLASSASLLRGALGVTALAALLSVCLAPLLACACSALACRFCAAVCEPVGDERVLRMMDAFADLFMTLSAAVAASAALVFSFIGATLGLAMRLYA